MRRTAFAILLGAAAFSTAMFAMPSKAPLSRLIENAEAKAAKNPKDVDAQYLLARLHSLGFAREDEQVYVYDPEGQVHVVGPVQVRPDSTSKSLTEPARKHLLASLDHYRKTIALEGKTAIYWLGYGWMLEQAGERTVDVTKGKYILAYEAYRKAYHIAWARDVRDKTKGPNEESVVSAEAAENLLRMDREGKHKLTPAQLKTLKAHLKLTATFSEMVTPIVFPLNPWTPLSQIDRPDITVPFNLDGTGRGHRWSWVSSNAAFLVWNPKGDGKIESGRDLFGNATFWMFFRHGYDALASLDDNRDGYLRGRELRDIAAWRDANSNGISEPGEVRSLASYGVTGIAAHAQGKTGIVWQHMAGIELWNGSSLPTYDWVSRSVQRDGVIR